MSEHLRERLHEEMSGQQPPPADGLVARAVAGGVRARRARRTASGLGTVGVVGLTVLAITFGSQIGAGPGSTSVSGQAGAAGPAAVKVAPKAVAKPKSVVKAKPVVAAAEVAPATSGTGTVADKVAEAQSWHAVQNAASAANPPQWTAAPSGVPATPQGELQLFSELATPYGTAGAFAVSSDADKTHVRAQLTAAGKTGGLQFSLEHDTLGQAGDCAQPAPNDITCHASADGGYVIVANDHAGCVNTADLTFVHPDGTAVHVFLASCLTDAANNLTQGTQTLSAAQAEAIFTNPGFDFTMKADVVARGAQNIGNLATFW
ncbi:hypothetical protein acdb102_46680 [Acidothermaceae bacterium B102]|nr:hypothetical protein acdb102_46680 [Acidothermaceae bacterium B102]